MTKILISILSILLTFFPFSGTLQSAYQNLNFPGEDVITSNIIDAVKYDDITAIEEMFSQNQKNHIEQLSSQLQNMFNLIDGEIINADIVLGTTSRSSVSGMGYAKESSSWEIKFETTTGKYLLIVCWTIVDTTQPKDVGLTCLKLMDSEIINSEGHEQLALIK